MTELFCRIFGHKWRPVHWHAAASTWVCVRCCTTADRRFK